MSDYFSDGKPKETKRNLATIEEFKAVMRKLDSQRIHISLDGEGTVEFWKRNRTWLGRSHGIGKPFKSKAAA